MTARSSEFRRLMSAATAALISALALVSWVTPVGASGAAPTADAGGPYVISEGATLALSASASTDPELDTLTYAWDLDNDGSFDDATGENPSVAWDVLAPLGVDDDGTYTVAVEVDDGTSATTDTASLTIVNTAPTVSLDGDAAAPAGGTYTLNVVIDDPGADTVSSWVVAWGDGGVDTGTGSPGTLTHTYDVAGLHHGVTVQVTDEDGTWSNADVAAAFFDSTEKVSAFDGGTGGKIGDFATTSGALDTPYGATLGADGMLYVASFSTNRVVRFDPTDRSFVDTVVSSGSGGLSAPKGLTFGPDGNLYVASSGSSEVLRYDGSTGAFIDTFVAATDLTGPQAVLFAPDGTLLVTDGDADTVVQFNGTTGAFIGVFATASPGDRPTGLLWGPDDNLYVAMNSSGVVREYDGATGALVGTFASTSLAGPHSMVWGPDGHLWVSDYQTEQIKRYDRASGSYLGVLVTEASPAGPMGLAVLPDQQVQVGGFVVNSTRNAGDNNTSDGVCDTGGSNAVGADECTLRAAMEQANASAGVDHIGFDIPIGDTGHSSGVWTIAPTGSMFSWLSEGVVIDGSTHPDYAGTPVIVLDGAGLTGTAVGIGVNTGADDTTVRAVSIVGFPDDGISSGANRVLVEDSYLGVLPSGTTSPGNGSENMVAWGGTDVVIRDNLIGNAANANLATTGGATEVFITGNTIGTDATGTQDWGAAQSFWSNSSGSVTIGGPDPSDANIIANSSWASVEITGSPASIAVVGNDIRGSGGLAIDLDDAADPASGITANDALDADTGTNGLLNFPEPTAAQASGGTVDLTFDLDVPTGTYRIDVFANPGGAHPLGNGEGEEFVGSGLVVHPGGGVVSFTVAAPGAVGDVLTTTATLVTGSGTYGATSEFSVPITAATVVGPPIADAGSAYNIAEGDAVALDASASVDPQGDPLTFQWDLDNDGTYGDVTGETPTVTWATLQTWGIDDDGAHTIGLRVDDGSESDTTSTSILVTNAEPVVSVTGDAAAIVGSAYSITIAATDPGDDTVTSYRINWGDGTFDSATAGLPATESHTYTVAAVRHISVEVTDEDGDWTTLDIVAPSSGATDLITRHDVESGTQVAQLDTASPIDTPYSVAVGPDGLIYVPGYSSNSVERYDPATNAWVDTFIDGSTGGLTAANSVAFTPTGNLLVGDWTDDDVLEFDGSTGAFIGTFATGGGLNGIGQMVYGPDGHLYVASALSNQVIRFDGDTGAFMDVFVAAGSGGLSYLETLAFSSDGELLVGASNTDEVKRYDASTGGYLGNAITAGADGLDNPLGLTVLADGDLLVSSTDENRIKRYESATFTYLGDVVTSGLNSAYGITTTPDLSVTVRAPLLVNSTDDDADTSPGDGVCDTGQPNAETDDECTLRAAIQEANALAGTDAISFAIPTLDAGHSAGVWSIAPVSDLPDITGPVMLDASTQPGFTDSPVVELDGSATLGTAINLHGGSSLVRGLAIHSSPNDGIDIRIADGNTVAGNYIGLRADGTTAAGNGDDGIAIRASSDGNTIGGPTAADRNVVGSNLGEGLLLWSSTTGNLVQGNYFGTDATGLLARGNGSNGVDLNGADGNTVRDNVISGNAVDGIQILGADNGTVTGNLIGVGADGVTAIGNGGDGITVNFGPSVGVVIGGTGAGDGNVIAHNADEGISLFDSLTDDIAILGNAIHSNTALGIDLLGDGVTPNDADDVDGGVNDLLNFPEITAATITNGTLTVDFDLDVPAGNYRVEAFTNPSGADPSGNGEGEVFESATTIAHTGSGTESFQMSFGGFLDDTVTLTATQEWGGGAYGSTSEFSNAESVTEVPCTGPDSDTDGLLDCEESSYGDTDGDTLANENDPDDDGDGTPTTSENADPNGDGDPRDAIDTDRDGQPDYLDLPTGAARPVVVSEQRISDSDGGLTAALDSGDSLGFAMTPIGDLDGDGTADLAAAAPYDDDGGTSRGAVHILFLNTDGTVKAEQKISDTTGGLTATLDDNDYFGSAVTGLGDIDGDGINDVAVGARGDDDGGTGRGAFYILFLNADGTVRGERKISDTTGGLTATLDDNDWLGGALSSLGDLDGDGINDVAVGADLDDDGGSGRGAVHILFLNADGTLKAEQKISSTTGDLTATVDDNDYFGSAVTGLGDLDGDGIPDLLVGAAGDDDGASNAGALHVLFLNADGTIKAEQKISALTGGSVPDLYAWGNFGDSVTTLGDVFGDGSLSIAAGRKWDSGGGLGRGAVLLLALDTAGVVTTTHELSNPASMPNPIPDYSEFGTAVAAIGDLDNDGAIGLAVSAVDTGDFTSKGAIYIVDFCAAVDADGDGLWDCQEDANTDDDGDPTTTSGPDTDSDTNANYNDADDDGDGTPTTSENADPNGDGDPRDALDTDRDGEPDYLDVEAGASVLPIVAEQKISSTAGGLTGPLDNGDEFGTAVSSIGDIDGDGVVDIVVGARNDGDGGLARGAVYVLRLNADGTVKAEQKISSTSGGLTASIDNADLFGFDATGIGDLDGDGIGDVAVGAFGDDDGSGSAGAVHILFLNADGTVRAEQKISETQGGLGIAQDPEDRFGNGLAGIGDLDGDGIRDLAVGVPRDDDGGVDRGAVHILFLNANGTVKAEQKISDTTGGLTAALSDNEWFGFSVGSPGDLDGDGLVDLVVGAPQDDDGGTDRGAVYVLLLNSDGTVKAEQRISQSSGGGPGLDDGDNFGTSVSGIGDTDNNLVGDIVVGASSDDDGGTDQGALYLLQLDATGSAIGVSKISATSGGLTGPLDASDSFGYRAAGLGDLDGDGGVALAVTAIHDDDGGTDRGAVYVLDLTPTCLGPDTDGDGLLDCYETPYGDTDGDTLANENDADDDGDGTPTTSENADPNSDGDPRDALDTDRDGQPDYLDPDDAGPSTTPIASEQKISSTQGGLTGPLDDGDEFGEGVAGIGDLDGDGITDMAVSAIWDDDGGTNRGAVHILFLNADGTVKAEQKISSTTGGLTGPLDDNDLFGHGLTALGDIDGDGVGDIAVGSWADGDGGTNRGAVYVLFLNADGTVKAEQKISSTTGGLTGPLDDGDRFGSEVAGIGDLDGDGVNDLVANARDDDDGGSNRGAIYVLFLNADGTVKAEQKISSTTGGLTGPLDDSDRFGSEVAGIGDLDGDGVVDVAVGARLDDDGGSNRGAVYVLLLNADGTVKAEQKISSTTGGLTGPLDDGDLFGRALGAAGDVDGDATPDIIVGATEDDDGGTDRGAAYILLLNPDGTVRTEQKISATSGGLTGPLDDGDRFGYAVTSLGDLDGDGGLDIAVGARKDDDGGTDRGAVYVLDLEVGCAANDADSDGILDCFEDANTDADDDPSTNPGPNTDGDANANYLDSDDDGDGALTASENPDPNGDGNPRDAQDADWDGQPDYLDSGRGLGTTPVSDEQKISAASGDLSGPLIDSDAFGSDVAAIGDVDGDGVVDLVVGAPFDDDGGTERGAVYVLFMDADGTVKAEQKISDTEGSLGAVLNNDDRFGSSVAGVGDVDGDATPDIAVGAKRDDDGGTNRGAVHILFLNANGTVKAEQKISDTEGNLTATLSTSDEFGSSASGIGDLDGDGVPDLAVGAPVADAGNTDHGRIYILFLNADGTVKAEQPISDTEGNLTATFNVGDRLGWDVAALGDLDGDGVVDIAAGALRDDDGGTNRGAVHILFLNTNGTVKAEQKISDTEGNLTANLDNEDYLGSAVSGPGDLDGDGIVDLIVGAEQDSDGGADRGAVHILLLNPDGTVKAEQKISDTEGNLGATLDDTDRFGASVAALGDLDDDGTVNVAVGAPGDDDGGTDRGAIHVVDLSTPTTIAVNDTGDAGDTNPGDHVCDTGGVNADGRTECTLRAAIEEANASTSIDTIDFAIPVGDSGHSSGVWTITPTAAYPNITDTVDLDARTQPGWSGTPVVEIDGSSTTTALGLHAQLGAGTTIAGFSIGDYTRPIAIQDTGAIVQANWVGVRADGTTTWSVRPEYAIRVINTADNAQIGGTGPDEGNVVVDATDTAIYLWNSDNVVIEGNTIGRLPDGTTAVPNGAGISIDGFTSGTTIGGTSAAAANLIADNSGDAIEVASGSGHAVLQNSIVDNGGLAIDIVGGTEDGFGVTANDAGDGDTGINDLLNHAVITSAAETAGTITVDFDLDAPAGDYVVIVYTNPSGADASGHGEAEVMETRANITHTGSGTESFATTYSGAAGDDVSLSVTEDLGAGDYGSSSEMSPTSTATLVVTATVNSTGDAADATPGDGVCATGGFNSESDPECTLRAAIEEANASAIDTIVFAVPTGDSNHDAGVWTLAPAAEYPEITAPVTIDGSTQSGYSMPVIQLEGTALSSTSEHGFTLAVGSDASTIRGLAIVDFPGMGIYAEGSDDHVVVGNHLGIEADGTTANGNRYGIYISGSSRTRIGGTTAADRNVIGANTSLGIAVYNNIGLSLDSLDVVITGNYVGTDATGMLDRGNATRGIFVVNGSSRTQIGGSTAAHANVVSGNGGAGIYVGSGSMVDSVIEGNLVGVTADQSAALPNDGVGIEATWSSRTIVTGNIVGASGDHGIMLTSADDATVTANKVGTDTTETETWTIGGDGIHVASLTDNATIGGPGGVSDTNVIVNATGHGIHVSSAAGTGNAIVGNRISDNGGLAIDLEGGTETTLGVTANDAGDADSGPNDLLNHPVITAISEGSGIVSVDYDVDVPAGTYRVEVFSSATPDPSGHGEAAVIETAATIAHTGSGAESFSIATPGTATDAWTITITEDLGGGDYGSTSEMSGVARATAPSSVVVNSTGDATDNDSGNGYCATGDLNTDGDAECTLRAAIAEANARADITTITFAIPTSDPGYVAGSPAHWVIAPVSSQLGSIEVDVLDATTQPGWVDQPIIELDGSLRSGGDDGIQAGRTGMEVRGFAITNWPDDGAHTNQSDVVFAGNWFGIDPTGAVAANGTSDLVIWGSADDVLIGGAAPGDRNVFAGAGTDDGVQVTSSADGVQIVGNTFGLSGDGVSSSSPTGTGILLADLSSGTVIDDNIFANTPNAAIDHFSSGTVTITGNVFGEDIVGDPAPFNTALWAGGTGQVTFGGTAPADANTVVNSSGDGISIVNASATVTILGNSITGSDELGIDIDDDDVSANDANDGDSGPNDVLNFPVVTAAAVSAGSTDVDFDLDVPAGDYRIEFFANPGGTDVSGNGEGETFLGATTVTHTGGGAESFSHTLAASAINLSTTTTEDLGAGSYGPTSEFSATVSVTGQDTAVVNSTGDTGDQTPGDHICDTGGANADGDPECTLRAAIEESNASSTVDTVTFAIPATDGGHSAGVWTITPASALPTLVAVRSIDASVQPGYVSVPVVVLDGSSQGSGAGLTVAADGATLQALAVTNAPGGGLAVTANSVNVVANHIGTDSDGTAAAGNTGQGMLITGTDAVVDNNLISGNTTDGLMIGPGAHRARVIRNRIGTNAAGDAALANGQEGIQVEGSDDVTIGQVGSGNVIAGNGFGGINGFTGTSSGVTIQGNWIGVGADGVTPIPNGTSTAEGGITVRGPASSWEIGGDGLGEGNVIANNNGDGVQLVNINGASDDIAILGNTISDNTGLAIDIDDDGVTANDTGDVDTGINGVLNFPEIRHARAAAGIVTIDIDLDVPAGDYRIEIFTNPVGVDPSGHGEAETFQNAASVTHTGSGTERFVVTYSGAMGDDISLTVTESLGSGAYGATSELSESFTVTDAALSTVNSSDDDGDLTAGDGRCDTGSVNTEGDAECTLRAAIEESNASGTTATIEIDVPASDTGNTGGDVTISPASPLPAVTSEVIIDATTQTGWAAATGPVVLLDGAAAGTSTNGIEIQAADTSVRGFAVAGFDGAGVRTQSSAIDFTLEHNWIGLDLDGTANPNTNGVWLTAGGSGANIGGAGVGNVVSGNTGVGITVADDATVAGNIVGLDPTGTTAVPNTTHGIQVIGGTGATTIGGAGDLANTVSGNDDIGIRLAAPATIVGNQIGVSLNGSSVVGNGSDNIRVVTGGDASIIGTAALGNTIRGATDRGINVHVGVDDVRIEANTVSDNGLAGIANHGATLLGNTTSTNGDLGIDHGDDGPTANDAGDLDGVPNAPVIGRVQRVGGQLVVEVQLDTAAGDHHVELFGNTSADPSGFGEGETFLGSAVVTHTGAGVETFEVTVTAPATILTATSTADLGGGSYGDTSEHSTAVPSPDLVIVNSTGDASDGSVGDGQCDTGGTNALGANECTLRAAIEEANDATTPVDTIWFDIPIADGNHASGVWTLTPATAYPAITETVTIDGTTQPGFVANTNAAPQVLDWTQVLMIDGSSAPSGSDGFWIQADDVALSGFAVGDFNTSGGYGVEVDGDRAVITAMSIGSDTTGMVARPSAYGIWSTGADLTVGGPDPADRNLVVASNGQITANGGDNLVVEGNLIGVSVDATTRLTDWGTGIELWRGANHRVSDNVIGGYWAIDASSGPAVIEDNVIGTDASFTADLGEPTTPGIYAFGDDITITGNVIGNWWRAITVVGDDVVITNNAIGTDPTATVDLGNADAAVAVSGTGTAATIGGVGATDGNVIAFSAGAGVEVAANTVDPSIVANQIFGNDGLGIDHDGDGVSPNDAGDADGLPNAAVLLSAVNDAGVTTLEFSLDVTSGTYRIDVYDNPSGADPSGYGEGERHLTAFEINHPGGSVTFTHPVAGGPGDVLAVTSTATGPLRATSEFSNTATAVDRDASTLSDQSQRRTDVIGLRGATADEPGAVGQALDVAGGSARIAGPALDLTSGSLTLSAWIEADASGADAAVISKLDSSGDVVYELGVDAANQATATIRVGGSATTVSGGSIAIGGWHQLAATWDGTDLALFVDGTEVDRTSVAGALATAPTTPLTLGNRADRTRPFDGRIDHVTVRTEAADAAELAAINRAVTDPASYVTVGSEQRSTPGAWTVGSTETRSGSFALQAPETAGADAAAWAVATGIDEPGMVFESYWWFSDDTGIDLDAGTRAGVVPTDQYEAALTSPSGWELRSRNGATETVDAAGAGGPSPGTWMRVEIWTDQLGDSRVFIDGTEVTGWTSQGSALDSGSVALRTGGLPSGEDWYIDDARARKLVTPEPLTSLAPLDRN